MDLRFIDNLSPKQKLLLGIGIISLACVSYTFTSVMVKKIGPAVPVNYILAFRYGAFLLFMLPLVLSKGAWRVEKKDLPIFITRGGCGLVAIGMFLYSLQFIPIATATVLSVSTPLFVPFLLRIFRKVPILPQLYWGLMLGLIGVVVIMNPHIEHLHIAIFLALASAVFRAGSGVAIRTLSKHSYSTLTMLFYYFLIGTVGAVLTLPANAGSIVGSMPWGLLLGVAFFGALYQVFLTFGYTLASIRLLTPFTYLSVVFAVIADWLLWHILPSPMMIVGMGLVIIGIVLVIYMGREIIEGNPVKH